MFRELERGVKPHVGADDMNRILNIESIAEQLNIEAEGITVEDISDSSIEKIYDLTQTYGDNV